MIRRFYRHITLFPFRYLPKGYLKTRLLQLILKFQNSVPLYLVLRSGDKAMQVGTPNFSTVQKFSRLVGRSGSVYIVEADGQNAKNLISRLPELRYPNVTLINKAAWSECTTIKFNRSVDFKGDHKVMVKDVIMDNDYRTEYEPPVEMEAKTIDFLCKNYEVTELNYISITVNGAEYEVLKGAKEMLSASPELIVFSKGHARMNSGSEFVSPINIPISKYLRQFGFNTIISAGDKSVSGIEEWERREGDVFAWKGKFI